MKPDRNSNRPRGRDRDMSVMNFDVLTRLTASEPSYADNAAGATSSPQSAFSNYLQRAQSQSADAAPASDAGSNLDTNDAPATGSQTPSMADEATARSASHAADRRDDSSARRQDATPAASPQHGSSPQHTANSGASSASKDNGNQSSQDSQGGSSNQDAPQPSTTTKEDNAAKIKKGGARRPRTSISTLSRLRRRA